MTISSPDPRQLKPEQLKVIADALNHRFKDAEFEISELPENPAEWEAAENPDLGWNPELLPEGSREVFEQLQKAEDWVDLQGNAGRVSIYRLKQHLPNYLKVTTKRSHGYRLVDLRKTA